MIYTYIAITIIPIIIFLIILITSYLLYYEGYKNKENYALADPHYFIDNDNPYFREDPHIMRLDPPIKDTQGSLDRMYKSQNVGDSRHLFTPDDTLLTLGKDYDFKIQVNNAIDNYRSHMNMTKLDNLELEQVGN